MSAKEKFNYPINVICFNRPEYLKSLMESIQCQTVEIPQNLLYFWVDGYSGSKDESINKKNETHKTITSIKKAFPGSHVQTSPSNLGIAQNYWRAEIYSFEQIEADSAFFLEEDIVLSPYYFELLLKVDSFLRTDTDIAYLSVTGSVAEDLTSPSQYFQTSGHSWGYLLRSWHYFERKVFFQDYIEMVSRQPYYLRKNVASEILTYFLSKGVVIGGISQDAIKDGLKTYFQRISISTIEPWAQNIGIYGEHFQGFSKYHNHIISHDLEGFPKSFDLDDKSRLFFDGHKKTKVHYFENFREHDGLKLEHDALKLEHDGLKLEHDALKLEHYALLSSTIWKFSRPLRTLITWIKS